MCDLKPDAGRGYKMVSNAALKAEVPNSISFEELRGKSIKHARPHIRSGAYTGHTAGIGPGMLQGNVAILPEDLALDFARFCQRNPQPCPLIGVSDTGNPMMHTLGDDLDIRTDVPKYRIYEHGELVDEVTDITSLWQDNYVAFVLGCSFTFEDALMAEGINLRHIDQNKTVSMFITNIETDHAGPFEGGTVVSMRPLPTRSAPAPFARDSRMLTVRRSTLEILLKLVSTTSTHQILAIQLNSRTVKFPSFGLVGSPRKTQSDRPAHRSASHMRPEVCWSQTCQDGPQIQNNPRTRQQGRSHNACIF